MQNDLTHLGLSLSLLGDPCGSKSDKRYGETLLDQNLMCGETLLGLNLTCGETIVG